ncbi:MAG: hypothetical protein J6Q82_03595 [Clostridia bacterium]|nr:hypothetical protein [Clostridia bacterium]
MDHQELFVELASAEEALKRSIDALIQASDRYCTTFPQSVKDGLPSYVDAKSNASAAYYMYAMALTYVLKSAEGILSSLSPLSEKANEEQLPEIVSRCEQLMHAYEQFSADALSPYFEESQRIIHASGDTVALSLLYKTTQALSMRSKEFLSRISS